MSSVTEIESAIEKLSVTEQRVIARHLGERLVVAKRPTFGAAADEGIRFLPQFEPVPRARKTRGASRRSRLMPAR